MNKLAHIFFIIFFATTVSAGNSKLDLIPNSKTIPLIAGRQYFGKLQGAFSQGGVAFGTILDTPRVGFNLKSITLNGKKVKFFKINEPIDCMGNLCLNQYIFILGFNRNEQSKSILEIQFTDRKKIKKIIEIKKREYEVQNIKGLPKKKVNPPPEVWERIKMENNSVGRARKTYSKTSLYSSGFISPAKGLVTGVYGTKRILNGQPKSPHYGIDIAAPAGTLIYAPSDGIITLINEDMYYTGKTVVMDHGHGLSSTFLHMQKVLVKDKQYVKQGDVIGKVGSTGRSTGSHLDWRMNVFKTRVDPAFFVPSLQTSPKK